MANFTTTRLVDGRVLVAGSDKYSVSGQTVVDATEWDEVNADSAYSKAAEDFDAAVADFFAPLTAAADKLNESLEVPQDADSYVVISEAVEGVEAKDRVLHHLSNDSIILRLVERGDHDRLVWVNDQLVVTVADTPLPTVEVPADASF
jgi:hypothetical protein